MKIVLFMLILISQNIYAEQSDYLEGATITVTLKNGKKYTYSAKDYAVVKRNETKKKAINKNKINKRVPKKKDYAFTMYGGLGPTHLIAVEQDYYYADVIWEYGVVVGAGFSKRMEDNIWVGANYLSNRTFLTNLMFDF